MSLNFGLGVKLAQGVDVWTLLILCVIGLMLSVMEKASDYPRHHSHSRTGQSRSFASRASLQLE